MRALNTIGRGIITGDDTISAPGAVPHTELDILFRNWNGGLRPGGVSGAAHIVSTVAPETVSLSDGTSITFATVKSTIFHTA